MANPLTNRKFIHFNNLANFENIIENQPGAILDNQIVFIKDARKIWTHGTYYTLDERITNDIYARLQELAEISADIIQRLEVPVLSAAPTTSTSTYDNGAKTFVVDQSCKVADANGYYTYYRLHSIVSNTYNWKKEENLSSEQILSIVKYGTDKEVVEANGVSQFPATGEADVVYIDTSTTPSTPYKWQNGEYVQDSTLIDNSSRQADWAETDSNSIQYIKRKPKLGTAAAKDVATSGDASNAQVVMGNDSRLANNVKGIESSINGSVAVFDGTSGKQLKQVTSISANEVTGGCTLNVGMNSSTTPHKAVINIRNGSGGTSQLQTASASTNSCYFAFPDVGDDTTSNQSPATIYTTKNKPSKSDVGLGNVTNDAQVKASEKGVENGVATLDVNGKVPASQLPSSYTDVVTQVNVGQTPYTPSSGVVSLPAYPTALPANGGNAATVNTHTVGTDVPANAVFTDHTYSVMGASGSTHASGLVPDTPTTAGTSKYLREDGTWVIPPASAINYTTIEQDVTDINATIVENALVKVQQTLTSAQKTQVLTNLGIASTQIRNIITSTSEPTSSDGNDGDIWLIYEN